MPDEGRSRIGVRVLGSGVDAFRSLLVGGRGRAEGVCVLLGGLAWCACGWLWCGAYLRGRGRGRKGGREGGSVCVFA